MADCLVRVHGWPWGWRLSLALVLVVGASRTGAWRVSAARETGRTITSFGENVAGERFVLARGATIDPVTAGE